MSVKFPSGIALAEARAALLGVALGTSIGGPSGPSLPPSPGVVAGLTSKTIILASPWVPTRRSSFNLATGKAKHDRADVVGYLAPTHLAMLQALLGIDGAGSWCGPAVPS